eukprot:GHVU01163525.1.p2 GENE.GHVU01163525.1~~GHVU01163525.1.p2  ORF type:complete len:192 (+),score=27.17 GHVU01163525.1:735-1310(+)
MCVCVCMAWMWAPPLPTMRCRRSITQAQLCGLLRESLKDTEEWADIPTDLRDTPFSFSISDGNDAIAEVSSTLAAAIAAFPNGVSHESTLGVTFHPLSTFKVRPVTRCTASLEGHTEAVLCAAFSPDGTRLASGSGDTTVRVWDLWTATPLHTCRGHTSWVLCLAWAPDSSLLASAGMVGGCGPPHSFIGL